MTTAVMLAVLAASHGSATLTTTGPAAESLRAQGVKLPAKLVLPVTAGSVSRSATLDMGKRLTLRRGKRSVTLSRWQARLGTRATLTARVGRAADRGAARAREGPAARRRHAQRAAAGRRADAGSRGRAGRQAATRAAAGAAGAPRADHDPRRAAGRAAARSADAERRRWSHAPGGGGGGTTTPPPATDPLPTLTRPAGAVDVVSATITWHVRESFVDYINSGGGTSTENGATSDPPYDFHFPFARGWRDPASSTPPSTTPAASTSAFRRHGIDMQAEDPEIELNGADSRAIFRLDGKREVLIKLHPDQAASHTTSPDGKTITYEQIPGTVPEGTGDSVFAGFYLPGDEFGWVSVRFSTA